MPFKPGHKFSPGRVKGSHNKKTWEARETLARLNFDPIAALHECYSEAKKIYDSYGKIYEAISKAREASGNPYPLEDKAAHYLKIAMDAAKELASYTLPKLKAIEHIKSGPLDGMTAEQKLEAMKHAVKALEAQVGTNDVRRTDDGSSKASSSS